jgi:hypothetical protein
MGEYIVLNMTILQEEGGKFSEVGGEQFGFLVCVDLPLKFISLSSLS